MDYQSLNQKTVVELRGIAKEMGVRIPAGTNKSALIDMLMEADRVRQAAAPGRGAEAPKNATRGRRTGRSAGTARRASEGDQAGERPAPRRTGGRSRRAAPAATPPEIKDAAPVAAVAPVAEPPEIKDATPAAAAPTAAERERRPAPVAQRIPTEKAASEQKAQPRPAEKSETADTSAKPEAQDAPPKAAEAAQGGNADARFSARNRMANPSRTNPRAAGENQQRQNRFQSWNGTRPAQGDARPQRILPSGAGSAPRPVNPRFGRPGEARPLGQAWENRDFQRRAPQQPAAQPENGQGAEQGERQRPEGYYNAELKTSNPAVPEMLASGECGDGAGVLEMQPDGYGFLRAENCLPGPNDVYISIAQIRRFNLRNGDHVVGKTRAQREGDRYSAMMYITEVNGVSPEKAAERPRFEDLVPIYPDQRLRLEPPEGKGDLSLRLIDMLAPIGKGQRGMIVSQPKAGKTTLLKKVANAITAQYPDVHLIVLLIDERPEEVTDMQRSIKGEVIYSTFDEEPEHHTRVSEMVLARAQRLVEMGKDVVVLMDSITRLARAYNLTITPTGRSLSGGLDPGALFKPKRFFGAARNIENGGSLTIIATALVETGSRMDDIIFEEFKGTGNMELHLDRKLSDRRVFPAIDLLKSGTRREELLLTEDEINGEYQVRRMLGGRQQEMYEQLIDLMTKTASNAEFFSKLKGWLAVYEKEGYSLGK